MKHLILVTFFCLTSTLLFAQNTQRNSLGISGDATKVTVGENTYYVSQSIGQSSVIGTFTNNSNTILQGFQQPPIQVKNNLNKNNSLNVVVYPNPINTYVTIIFSELSNTVVNTVLYDVTGREVYLKSQDSTSTFQVDMSLFSSGIYLLKIISGDKYFTARLIKK